MTGSGPRLTVQSGAKQACRAAAQNYYHYCFEGKGGMWCQPRCSQRATLGSCHCPHPHKTRYLAGVCLVKHNLHGGAGDNLSVTSTTGLGTSDATTAADTAGWRQGCRAAMVCVHARHVAEDTLLSRCGGSHQTSKPDRAHTGARAPCRTHRDPAAAPPPHACVILSRRVAPCTAGK